MTGHPPPPPEAFIVHELTHCEVTFVRRIMARSEEEAIELHHTGEGDLLGVAIGDLLASHSLELTVNNDLPVCFYPEPQ
jgi:hypothetical protein